MIMVPRSNSRTGGVGDAESTDILRRLSNLLRMGRVHSADYPAARIRVVLGDPGDPAGHNVTAWIPWLTARAGGDREWWAPEPGEPVLVLSPGGELANAVALPAAFSSAAPAPADSADIHRIAYADGAVLEYDRAAHRLSATIPGAVSITAAGEISIQATGPVSVTSSASVAISAPAVAISSAGGGGGTQATMTGNFALNGRLDVTGGDVTADGISLKTHRHPETGEPIP